MPFHTTRRAGDELVLVHRSGDRIVVRIDDFRVKPLRTPGLLGVEAGIAIEDDQHHFAIEVNPHDPRR